MYKLDKYRTKPQYWYRKCNGNQTYSMIVYKKMSDVAKLLLYTATTHKATWGATTIPHKLGIQPYIDNQLNRKRSESYKYHELSSGQLPPGCLRSIEDKDIYLNILYPHSLSLGLDGIGGVKYISGKLLSHLTLRFSTIWKPGCGQSNGAGIWAAGGNIKDDDSTTMEFLEQYLNEDCIDDNNIITIEVEIDSHC